MEPVGGDAWHDGSAIWKVTYEYADSDGGGEAFDYFKTANRRTPPTGAGVKDCVDSDHMTLLGIEGIEFDWVEGISGRDEEALSLEGTKHGRLFDLTADTRGAGGRLEVRG